MKGRKPLINITVNEELFNKLLYKKKIKEYSASLEPYICGYQKKQICYYNEKELIMQKWEIDMIRDVEVDFEEGWKQVVVTLRRTQQDEIIDNAMSPIKAVNYLNHIIHKKYTKDEKLEIFSKFEREEQPEILRYSPLTVENKILCIPNCYYYDANGAYASKLIQMFPKCEDELTNLFEHRHDNNNRLKCVFNYYVGMLTQSDKKRAIHARKIYPKTRNWIVQGVTDDVNNLLNKLDSEALIYAHTDGVIVKNPKNPIEGSKKMGEFKLEYQGDILTYRTSNYTLMQMGDKMDGSLPLCLRDKVDLRKGQVVQYRTVIENGAKIYKDVKVIQLNKGDIIRCQEKQES